MTSSSAFAGIRRTVVVATVAAAMATACSDAGVPRGIDPVASASVVVSVPERVGREGCDRGSSVTEVDGGLEVEGRVDGLGELWALFATDQVRAGEPIDVHWRIDGDKTMRVVLVGPNDRVVSVTPPKPDPSLTWDRPGEPWSGTITFPQSGCWRVYVERARVRGDLWVEVA